MIWILQAAECLIVTFKGTVYLLSSDLMEDMIVLHLFGSSPVIRSKNLDILTSFASILAIICKKSAFSKYQNFM